MEMCNNKNLPAQRPNVLMTADPAAVAAAETVKARISAAYLVAMQNPRDEDQARARILAACRRPLFAEKVEYSKPAGGQSIKGPSVRFAELAIREWGNIMTETQVVYENEDYRRIRVTLMDLQTNASHSKEIQVSKRVERRSKGGRDALIKQGRDVLGERQNSYGDTVYIVRATDEELYQKEAALISKAVRNEGLRLIPSDIVDEGISTARATMRNEVAEDPDAYRKQVMDAFAALNILPADLEQFLGHPISTASVAEMEELRGVYQALKEGDATWSDYLDQPGTSGDVKDKTLSQAEKLKQRVAKAKNGAASEGSKEAATPAEAGAESSPESQSPQDDAPAEPDDFEGMSSGDLAAWISGYIHRHKVSKQLKADFAKACQLPPAESEDLLRGLAREIAQGAKS